jgi:hypothetical protein
MGYSAVVRKVPPPPPPRKANTPALLYLNLFSTFYEPIQFTNT